MNRLVPDLDSAAAGEDAAFRSLDPVNGDVAVLPDYNNNSSDLSSGVPIYQNPCLWSNLEGDCYSDIFRVLSDVELNPTPPPPLPPLPPPLSNYVRKLGNDGAENEEYCETWNSKGKVVADHDYFRTQDRLLPIQEVEGKCESVKAKQDIDCSSKKRKRSAEMHNSSERRRRNRIKEKMNALQELIPNCNKLDKVSMLDEAIEYLKTLQMQLKIVLMGGLCQFPFISPAGMECLHRPQFPPFSTMTQRIGMDVGFGMGMGGMGYSSATSLPSFPGLGVLPMPQLPLPIQQLPFIPSPALPETATTGFSIPVLVSESLPLLNSSNTSEMCSTDIQGLVVTDCEWVPMETEKSNTTDTDPTTLPKICKPPL
ncbi:uncharacterized protein LOC143884784 [Tasmannia lanceolata]|uniref:uncharacterized protein LOC143884784 n=1 Tax=Tasmannia lanceolata TaxID=3420 RepID=UPI00406423A5